MALQAHMGQAVTAATGTAPSVVALATEEILLGSQRTSLATMGLTAITLAQAEGATPLAVCMAVAEAVGILAEALDRRTGDRA